jgi:hypothetical protein
VRSPGRGALVELGDDRSGSRRDPRAVVERHGERLVLHPPPSSIAAARSSMTVMPFRAATLL